MSQFFTKLLTKKKIVVILIVGIGGYGTYYTFFHPAAVPTQIRRTATVQSGSIENSIKTTGTANLVNEQKIRFNQQGKIKAIYFQEWQQVKQGDIIAELDATDVQNSIRQAEISLSNARIALEEELKPAEAKDLLQAENSVTKSESDIANAEASLANLRLEQSNKVQDAQSAIASKERSIDSNATDFENKKTAYSSDLQSKQDSLVLAQKQLDTLIASEGKSNANTNVDIAKTISSAFADAKKQLADANLLLIGVDEVFGVSESRRYLNDSYEIYISTKNTGLKTQVETDWNAVNALYLKNLALYSSLNTATVTTDQIKNLLSGLADMYSKMVTLWADASEAMKASMASTAYQQSTIDSNYSTMVNVKSQGQSGYDTISTTIASLAKLSDPTLIKAQSDNDIAKQRLTIQDLQASIDTLKRDTKTALENLATTRKTLQSDLASLQNNLPLTTASYDAQIAQSEANIKNLRATLELNRANLAYVKRGTASETIARSRNDVAKQEIALADTKKSLEKYRIEAPFDGVLRQIDFKVGDNITSDDTKYLYIDNPNLLEISATLDQIDIAKVSVGQDVKIVFDSFTNLSFTGKVTQINSTPISTSGVTSYTIKVAMDKWKHQIYSGMTAKLTIVVAKKEGVLTIPSEYVLSGSGRKTVIVDNGSQRWKRTEIVTGVSTSTVTEVVSGLSLGDTVIRFVTPTTSSSASSSLNLRGTTGTRNSSSSSRSSGGIGGPPGGF